LHFNALLTHIWHSVQGTRYIMDPLLYTKVLSVWNSRPIHLTWSVTLQLRKCRSWRHPSTW